MQQPVDHNAGVEQAAGDPAATPAPVQACRACQASMAPDQDWCLTCGAAAPGRLGARPGWRTVNSVAALTLVLITGAVAASYAALSGDASTKAGQTPPASVAPVPGAVAQVPDAPVPATPPVATPPPAAPTVKPPKTSVTPAPARPVVPTPTPAPVSPVTPSAGKTDTPTGKGETTTDERPTPTPAVTLTKLELGADAMSVYDPAKRATRSGDPADAYDGDKTTAWSVTTPDDEFPMQVGLLVDLESPKTVRQLNLGITTPGGRVEVYGATGSALPPDILDTRWEQVAARSKLDQSDTAGNQRGDNAEKISLRQGGAKFRYVLLWFTNRPTVSSTVRVSELDLLG